MTNFDWAKLGFKLTGLWFMVSAVTSAANLASILGRPEVTGIAFSLLRPLTGGLIGLLIWMNSERLASSIFPTTVAAENLLARSQQEQLFALAISIFGVVFVMEAIPTLVYNATLFVVSRSGVYRSAFGFVSEGEQSRIWSATAEAGILAAFARTLIGRSMTAGTVGKPALDLVDRIASHYRPDYLQILYQPAIIRGQTYKSPKFF